MPLKSLLDTPGALVAQNLRSRQIHTASRVCTVERQSYYLGSWCAKIESTEQQVFQLDTTWTLAVEQNDEQCLSVSTQL